MSEKRYEDREPFEAKGLFIQDGVITEIRLRDAHTRGVGAYAPIQMKPGQQGVLQAKLPSSNNVEEIPTEVCWCLSDPMAKDFAYRYRMGLRLLA